jgi:uncharacterized protein YegL
MMSQVRRLPVYLLIDTSGSMAGEPIEAVRQGVRALLSDLKGDPQALESAYLSIITFSSSAKQLVPLTELMTFNEPQFDAGGSTMLGEALKLLERCLDTEVRKSTATQKGDYRPLVFVMTDGQPTDKWEEAADRIRARKPANIIACAAGSAADVNMLKRITETVVSLSSLKPDDLKAFFKWVSSSIKLKSVPNAAAADPSGVGALPKLPSNIQMVP